MGERNINIIDLVYGRCPEVYCRVLLLGQKGETILKENAKTVFLGKGNSYLDGLAAIWLAYGCGITMVLMDGGEESPIVRRIEEFFQKSCNELFIYVPINYNRFDQRLYKDLLSSIEELKRNKEFEHQAMVVWNSNFDENLVDKIIKKDTKGWQYIKYITLYSVRRIKKEENNGVRNYLKMGVVTFPVGFDINEIKIPNSRALSSVKIPEVLETILDKHHDEVYYAPFAAFSIGLAFDSYLKSVADNTPIYAGFSFEIPEDEAYITKPAKIVIIGAGMLGTLVAFYLTLLAKNKVDLYVFDPDIVKKVNMNRLVPLCDKIGQPKVKALKEFLEEINPNVRVHPIQDKASDITIEQKYKNIFEEADIIINVPDSWIARDNMAKYIANVFPDKWHLVGGVGIWDFWIHVQKGNKNVYSVSPSLLETERRNLMRERQGCQVQPNPSVIPINFLAGWYISQLVLQILHRGMVDYWKINYKRVGNFNVIEYEK